MRTTTDATAHSRLFEQHRGALFGAAYRVLGTVSDAEDAVQETWLAWAQVDLDGVRDARAYLARAATRHALNIVRARRRRREEYPGPWLPEPISTGEGAAPDRAAELADDVSLALLVVLESLSPLERAAFVLRDVFALPHAEVAQTLDRSEEAVRQLVSRARAHVRERAPRHPVDAETHRRVTDAFLAATRGIRPVDEVVSLMAPDVVLTSDGGGRSKAARRPVLGREKVMRFVAGVLATPEVAALEWHAGEINGMPAMLGVGAAGVDTVVWFEVDGGLVTDVYLVRNPDKLHAVRVPGAVHPTAASTGKSPEP
ncbi:RNA polymerase sigma factor SigJ [Georgenia deserti]|uniref:RNA polymerase sigma factor SigJ n=1 Tax=Georgenia deserti TaxID=2093781 RepID=A0ABW4L8G8_9MICO